MMRLVGICVVCEKRIYKNDHTTRVKFCGPCYDIAEGERLRLMGLIRKAAVWRARRIVRKAAK